MEYIKIHKSKKGAEIHKKKIEARGGNADITEIRAGYRVVYSFPKRPKSPKKPYQQKLGFNNKNSTI